MDVKCNESALSFKVSVLYHKQFLNLLYRLKFTPWLEFFHSTQHWSLLEHQFQAWVGYEAARVSHQSRTHDSHPRCTVRSSTPTPVNILVFLYLESLVRWPSRLIIMKKYAFCKLKSAFPLTLFIFGLSQIFLFCHILMMESHMDDIMWSNLSIVGVDKVVYVLHLYFYLYISISLFLMHW